jgi:hypothetical protein
LLWTNSDFDVGLMSAPGSSAEVQPHPILSPLYRRKRTQPAHGYGLFNFTLFAECTTARGRAMKFWSPGGAIAQSII